MDLVDKINKLLKDEKKTQKSLAEFIGIQPSTLNKILKKDTKAKRKLSAEQLILVAKFFSVHEGYFSDNMKSNVKKIPIIGTSSCGSSESNLLQVEDSYCIFSAEKWNDKLFCVVADGDSMAPEIENGDHVICDPSILPKHGELTYYTVNGESAIKVFVENKEAGIVMLKPINANKHFKTTVFRIDEDIFDDVKFAKVVGINKTNFNNVSARLKLVGEQ